jgi:hypothetical protein
LKDPSQLVGFLGGALHLPEPFDEDIENNPTVEELQNLQELNQILSNLGIIPVANYYEFRKLLFTLKPLALAYIACEAVESSLYQRLIYIRHYAALVGLD